MSFPRKGYPLVVEDCEEIPLKNKNGWSLQGFSKAGERTGFKVNPINVLLDAGLLCVQPPQAILLTHCHVDHTWNLPNITGGSKVPMGNSKIPVFFPKQAYLGLTKLLEAACILSYPGESFTEQQVWERHLMIPRPVEAGDLLHLSKAKVEVLQAVHTAHSVGYGISTEKSKLKEEYQCFAGDQPKIVELRKQGIEVVDRVLQPEFAFFCDSTIDNLLNYTEWKKYPTVVVECTGYPEIYEVDLVHKRGHTHYTDLMAVMNQHKDKNWFLIHSSMKCDEELLQKYQAEFLSKGLNVKILSVC